MDGAFTEASVEEDLISWRREEVILVKDESTESGNTQTRAGHRWTVCAVPVDAEADVGSRFDFLYVPAFYDGP
jgi:hypothetical protein